MMPETRIGYVAPYCRRKGETYHARLEGRLAIYHPDGTLSCTAHAGDTLETIAIEIAKHGLVLRGADLFKL